MEFSAGLAWYASIGPFKAAVVNGFRMPSWVLLLAQCTRMYKKRKTDVLFLRLRWLNWPFVRGNENAIAKPYTFYKESLTSSLTLFLQRNLLNSQIWRAPISIRVDFFLRINSLTFRGKLHGAWRKKMKPSLDLKRKKRNARIWICLFTPISYA